MSAQGDALRRTLYAAELKERVELAIDVSANVAIAMPVATGWARANTVLSIGQPHPGPIGAPGDASAADAAQAEGFAAVMAATDPRADVCVSNHVPYLPRLNAGSSPQAAAGFLEKAVDEAVAAAQARHDAKVVEL